jgi:hypothetical protein
MGAIKRHLVIKHSMLVLVLTCKRAHTRTQTHTPTWEHRGKTWKLRENMAERPRHMMNYAYVG